MKRKRVAALTFGLAFAFAVVLLSVASSSAQAQSCKAFHGFTDLNLPTTNQFAETDTWGGPIYINLDGEFLQGGLSGNDGTEYPHGQVSIFKGGEYKVCLTSAAAWGGPNDCLDSFTYRVPHAAVIWPSGKFLGNYKASANIVKGSGKFASASGQLDLSGPFIVWPDTNSVFGVSGRGNIDVSGTICGVK